MNTGDEVIAVNQSAPFILTREIGWGTWFPVAAERSFYGVTAYFFRARELSVPGYAGK